MEPTDKQNAPSSSLLVERKRGLERGRHGRSDLWVLCTFGDKKSHRIRLDQYYGEFINAMVEAGRDKDGKDLVFLTMNPSGDKRTIAARIVIDGRVDIPLHLSRILMDAEPREVIIKSGERDDYRTQSLMRQTRTGAELNRTRELLFETIGPIVGAERLVELQTMLSVADAIHRTDAETVSHVPDHASIAEHREAPAIRDYRLLDFRAFGRALLVLLVPSQGWQPFLAEPVPGGTAYWFGPLHWAVCRT